MILHGERNLDEERTVEKLLRAMPKKYAQLKIAIETLLDFQDLTIEEVIRRLMTVDDLDDEPAHEPVSVGGKLMLTEEQWLAHPKEEGRGWHEWLYFLQWRSASTAVWREEAEGENHQGRRRRR